MKIIKFCFIDSSFVVVIEDNSLFLMVVCPVQVAAVQTTRVLVSGLWELTGHSCRIFLIVQLALLTR